MGTLHYEMILLAVSALAYGVFIYGILLLSAARKALVLSCERHALAVAAKSEARRETRRAKDYCAAGKKSFGEATESLAEAVSLHGETIEMRRAMEAEQSAEPVQAEPLYLAVINGEGGK